MEARINWELARFPPITQNVEEALEDDHGGEIRGLRSARNRKRRQLNLLGIGARRTVEVIFQVSAVGIKDEVSALVDIRDFYFALEARHSCRFLRLQGPTSRREG